jgi:hypothetical protein
LEIFFFANTQKALRVDSIEGKKERDYSDSGITTMRLHIRERRGWAAYKPG